MAESRGGKPVSGSQRPTGGDKAIVSNKRQFFRRRKVCKFCVEKIDLVDYKDARMLSQFISERGKIVPRRLSGVCTPCQRRLAEAVKQARSIALLPFATGIPRG
jgi:small subunit ribosomal protein S18